MKIVLKIAALMLGLSVFAAAHAQSGLYVGANVAQAKYKEDGAPAANPTAVAFKIGSQVNENFAAEVRLGTGLSDNTVNVSGVPVTLSVDNFYGFYAKGIIPVTSYFAPYALIGYTHAKLIAKAGNFSMSASDSDFSYGVGADFPIAKNVALNLEWARLLAGDGYKVNALSFGATYKF